MLKSLEEPAVALHLADAAATERLGADLALAARPGDRIHLHGDLGAGKTTLARGFVRAMAGAEIDVPSPTFTLVQVYEGRLPVLHGDLYRVEAASESDELGFDEIEDGVLLLEWPGRGGERLDAPTLEIELQETGGGRTATIWGAGLERARRTLEVRAFLAALGKPDAPRRHLVGDASARSYETIPDGSDRPRIIMNAPDQPDGRGDYDGVPYSQVAHLAETVRPFVAVDEALRAKGLAAPRIHAADLDAGLLLIENLGTGSIARDGVPVEERYEACAAFLAGMHGLDWSRRLPLPDGTEHRVPDYDRRAMGVEVSLLADWYARDVLERDLDAEQRRRFNELWDALFDRVEADGRTLVLRDFHSPNIVWRDECEGVARIGLIDFQDAVFGPAAYDLASLAQDARVDISGELEARLVALYCETRWPDGAGEVERFRETYAIMAAQRASKILGIFVRLDLRDGKPAYRAHLPRLRGYIARSLEHPVLAELAAFYREAFDL